MANITYAAIMAELAEASYADLQSSNIIQSLEDESFSNTQASEFVQAWSVISGSHQPNTNTGFSATIFQGKPEAEDLSGEYVLAIRGTEPGLLDLVLTDGGDIILDGLAVDQIIDLYNYTQRLTNIGLYEAAVLTRVNIADPTDVTPEYAQQNGLLFLQGFNDGNGLGVYRIDFEPRTDGLGILPAGTPLHVTGHSLGGHLAAAFSRLFPAMTSNVTMINGAGFSDGDPLIANNFNVSNLFNMLGGANSFNPGIINNYIGTAGWDFISQDWFIGLQQPGDTQQTYTESFSGPIIGTNTTGHGSSQMTNVLTIMSLFDQLDTTDEINIGQLNNLFEASAKIKNQTFERVVHDLAKLFNVDGIDDFDTDSTSVGREALFSRIKEIKEVIEATSNTKVISLVNEVPVSLKVKALGLVEPENALAYRYSLANLTTFVVTGDDSIYNTNHNSNDELKLYNPENGDGNITDQFLQDAADFLSLRIQLGKSDKSIGESNSDFREFYTLYDDDGEVEVVETKGRFAGSGSNRFYHFGGDADDNISAGGEEDALYGWNGNDKLDGKGGNDHLEGQLGNDELIGGTGRDAIFGGQGNDRLYGISINGTDDKELDRLYGGKGSDTFYVGNSDIIEDFDKDATIEFNGLNLTGITFTEKFKDKNNEGLVYKNESANIFLTIVGNDAVIQKVDDVTKEVTSFRINNFKEEGTAFNNGDFGITLSPDTTPPIEGDVYQSPADKGHIIIQNSELNINAQQLGPFKEVLGNNLTIFNDIYEADTDKAAIYFLSFDERIEIQNSHGITVKGGDGREAIIGKDVFNEELLRIGVYVPEENSPGTLGQGVTLFGGSGDDYLEGQLDDDTIYGDEDDDYIKTFSGDDEAFGGEGNDILISNDAFHYFFPDLISATDTLDGGLGNDFVLDTFGNDVLFGDKGNDVVSGGPGSDILLGGEGDDLILGDIVVAGNFLPGVSKYEFNYDLSGRPDSYQYIPGDGLTISETYDFQYTEYFYQEVQLPSGPFQQITPVNKTIINGYYDPGNDVIDGGMGNDYIRSEGGDDNVQGGDGNDSIFGGKGKDQLFGGKDDDQIKGGDDDDYIDGGEDDDILYGEGGSDILRGGEGEGKDQLYGGNGDDELIGGEGNDVLYGENGNDKLNGGDGNDRLYGGIGNDVLIGGKGQDILSGGGGQDTFYAGEGDTVFGGGDDDNYVIGSDVENISISDPGGEDTILLGGDFSANDVVINRSDNNYTIVTPDGEVTISLTNTDPNTNAFETLSFADGTKITDVENNLNNAPVVTSQISDQTIDEDSTFQFVIPANVFTDAEGHSFTYSTGYLPSWLSFDATTNTLSGTPSNGDVEQTTVQVFATDEFGASNPVSNDFTITVNNTNDAPEVIRAIANQDAVKNFNFNYQVPTNTFQDVDVGDSLIYSATLADNSELPDWLTFDAATQTFSGLPGTLNLGELDIKVTATDTSGASVSDTFKLDVQGSSDTAVTTRIIGNSSFLFHYLQGYSISGTGDVNNDGYGDLVIGSVLQEQDGVATAPQSYVVYGKEGGIGNELSLLNDLNGANGFLIQDVVAPDGYDALEVTGLSDVNGDGLSDFAIFSSVFNRSSVVFGSATGFGSSFNLTSLNGNNGISLSGIGSSFNEAEEEGDPDGEINYSGNFISSAGDINGDGYSDILASGRGNISSNETYVIFGNHSGNITTDVASLNGANGFELLELTGSSTGIGSSLASLGDINNDGFDDIAFGSTSGQSFVVFGKASGYTSQFDLSSLDGTNGFVIQGTSTIITHAGDVNNDGINDVIAMSTSGQPHILYGNSTGFSSTTSLNTLSSSDGSNINITANLIAGGKDINDDGIDDVIISNGTEAYVIFGQDGVIQNGLQASDLSEDTGFRVLLPSNILDIEFSDDINGDGVADILIGTAGETYIIYGGTVNTELPTYGTDGDDIIVITDSDTTVIGGEGDDQITINDGTNVTVDTGNGDDLITIDLSGASSGILDSEINVLLGDGNNTINVNTGFKSSISVKKKVNDPLYNPYNSISFSGPNSTLIGSPAKLSFGSLKISFDGNPVEIHLEDFDPNDVLGGPRSVDEFVFSDTTLTYEQLVALGFDLDGTSDHDVIDGTNVVDRISGLEGNDTLNGADGNDTISGGQGNDIIDGGMGDDIYVFNLGDGNDIIADPDGIDNIQFGIGIDSSNLTVERIGNAFVLQLNANDSITVQDWYLNNSNRIEQFDFTDGAVSLTDLDIENSIVGNQAPIVSNQVLDQFVNEDTPFSFSIPGNSYSDPDPDFLTYSAALSDGSVLPSWLSFNAETQTFSGTPSNDDTGNLEITVTATDPDGLSVSDEFRIFVNDVNDAPFLSTTISDQTVDENTVFNFTIPSNSFDDIDSFDSEFNLNYSADLSNSSDLPSWINFDSATRTFSGIPGVSDVGSIDIRVTATDGAGDSVSDVFALNVTDVNNAPVLTNLIDNVEVDEGTPFSFTIPGSIFSEQDTGDSLIYSALLNDDTALPSWLSFDDVTQTFIGTPGSNDSGAYDIKLSATDTGGLSTDGFFTVTVNDIPSTNSAPVLNTALLDQVTRESDIFSFSMPENTFSDPDGDTLTYTASLNDDSVLPGWLNFDSATLTFSGTPGNEDVGSLDVKVTVSDGALNVDDIFRLNIFSAETLLGSDLSDNINGTNQSNSIVGLSGNDVIKGFSGNDFLYGNNGDDNIYGGNGIDFLSGGSGNDYLNGGKSDDSLDGGSGNNTLIGGNGDDTLKTGTGDDNLIGGNGNDLYILDSNFGNDSIYELGGNDVIKFKNISHDQLWFWQSDNNLNIGVIGTTDSVSIEGWYLQNNQKIESFNTAINDQVLISNQVQQLVDAMAVFNVESAGNLNISQQQQDEVQSVIAAAWAA